MSEAISTGDVIQLKSGGPKMVATSVEDRLGTPSVFCEWFDEKNKAQTGVFSLTSVQKVPPQPSAAALGARGPRVV